jgi:hypothetical protein
LNKGNLTACHFQGMGWALFDTFTAQGAFLLVNDGQGRIHCNLNFTALLYQIQAGTTTTKVTLVIISINWVFYQAGSGIANCIQFDGSLRYADAFLTNTMDLGGALATVAS